MKRPIAAVFLILSLLLLFTSSTISVGAQESYPDVDAEALLEYILNENPYTEWNSWPGQEELLDSGVPHGGVVRIYVNDVAYGVKDAFPGAMPVNSIVVKENYSGSDISEPGELDALTVMYKTEDFNPDAGNWYWVKAPPDGSSVDAAGAPDGCIACHGGIAANRDYILRYGFGGEPALASADDLDMSGDSEAEEMSEGEAEEMSEGEAEEMSEGEAETAPEALPETGAATNTQAFTIAFLLIAGLLLIGTAAFFRRAGLA